MLCNFYEEFGFTARWITLAGIDKVKNCALECYRKFTYSFQEQQPPLLRIAAESYYVLYLNGQFVGRGPARGTYRVNYFDTYDISAFLREGENHIAVMLQSMNAIGNYNSYPAGCALLAELPGVVATDSSWKIRKMPGWVNTEEFFTVQHGYKVEMDLRKASFEKWQLGEGTEMWCNASIYSSAMLSRKALRPRGIPELPPAVAIPRLLKAAKITLQPSTEPKDFRKRSDTGTLTPATARSTGSSQWSLELPASEDEISTLIYDFGTPRLGYFDFTVSGDNLDGIRLDVIYGEELWNGRLRTVYPLEIYSFTDTYILRNGENRIWHPFEMHGATMLQLNFSRAGNSAPCEVTVSGVRCTECRYPYLPDTQFRCSDSTLERIWELCRETMAVCTTDVFIDCPWREHAFWVNDLLVENKSSLTLFGPSDIHRHCLDVLFSQQFQNGWIPGVAPDACTHEKPLNLLSPTMLFLFIVMEDYLMESADYATVRRYLPNLRRILEAFEATADKDGLVQSLNHDSNFYDWGFELNKITFNNVRESMINSLYISALKIYLKLCSLTQANDEDAPELTKRISRVSGALRLFMETDSKTGRKILTDNAFAANDKLEKRTSIHVRSELSQALAVLSGALTAEENEDLLKNIIDGKLHRPELYLQSFVFKALEMNGFAEEALNRIRKYWTRVIARGATTIPEAAIYGYGRELFWESGSLCHGFSTCPADFFRRVILGVRPLKPGYQEFSIKPVPCGLTYASGKVYTPYGTISVHWEKTAEGVRTTVECPPETRWIQA